MAEVRDAPDDDLSAYSLVQLVVLAAGLNPLDPDHVYWVKGVIVDAHDPATAGPPHDDPPADPVVTLRVARVLLSLSEQGLLHLGAEAIRKGKRRRGGIANQLGHEQSLDLAERDRRICQAYLNEIRAGRQHGAKARLASRFQMSAANVGLRIRKFLGQWSSAGAENDLQRLEAAIRKSRQV